MSDRMRYLRPERFGNLVPRAHYVDSAAPTYSPDPVGITPSETVPQSALAPPVQQVSPAPGPFSTLPSQRRETVVSQKLNAPKSGKQVGASASSAGAKSDAKKTKKIIHFDTARLHQLLVDLFAEDIHYEIGKGLGKVDRIASTEPSGLRGAGLDCSGFVRYVLCKVINNTAFFRGGSWMQREWCEGEFTSVDYKSSACLMDNYVRIGFRESVRGDIITPKTATKGAVRGKKKVGHVWLVINGQTYESTTKRDQYGKKNNGPASLHYSERTKGKVHCFALGPAPGFSLLCHQTPII